MKFIEQWQKSRREARALTRIVDAMKTEREAMFANLEFQVEQRLLTMTPEERAESVRKLHRAIEE